MNTSRRGLSPIVMVFVLLLFCPVSGEITEQKATAPATISTPAGTPVPAVPTVIPVPDVAPKAAEIANMILKITEGLSVDAETERIRASLPTVSRQIGTELTSTMNHLKRQPTLIDLQADEQQWEMRQSKQTAWLSVLTKRSTKLQEALDRLTESQKLWTATLDASKASKAPAPILQQIEQTVAKIKEALIPLKEQMASVLDLQSSVAQEMANCDKALAAIEQIQKEALASDPFMRYLPIWSAELWTGALTAMPNRARDIAVTFLADISNYFKDTSTSRPQLVCFILSLAIFLSVRHQIRRWDDTLPAFKVFDHPFSASMTVVLFLATAPTLWGTPGTIRELLRLLALAPLIILIRPVIGARWLPGLYLLGVMLALGVVRRVFGSQILIEQGCLAIQSLLGIAGSLWYLSNNVQTSLKTAVSSGIRARQAGFAIVLVILAMGFASTIAGYLSLARQLTPSVTALGFLTLELYAIVLVCNGLAVFGLRVWPLRTLGMALHHRVMVERKIYRILLLLAGVSLVVRYLNVIGLLGMVLSTGKAILSTKFERSGISITPGDILEFVLVVWAAYLLSSFIRFVLKEDIYPRIGITRGKSYAVSSLLHYFIVALGFTIAIAAMGVNLSKMTVLTGALGVGIGFGLQSVVNNFVSGLILLFERPIQVGDAVELGDLMGKVRRIGIRASTVHTIQGADIIVPNSQLVTEKVTNWTLSDQLRRIDLPVGVNYGAAPQDVIEVLETVAQKHPHILQDPAPVGLFTGFGDRAINFELRAWTDQFDNWTRIKSELAAAVYDAVNAAAGITFPSSELEVRLLRDSDMGNLEGASNRESETQTKNMPSDTA